MKAIRAHLENWNEVGIVLVQTDGKDSLVALVPRCDESPFRRDDKTVHVLMSVERLASFADDIKKLIDYSINAESTDQLHIDVSTNGERHSGLVSDPK